MPIYDYQCSACGHRIEVFHGVNEGGPAACPACGGTMRKLFAPPAVHFKGTGWAKKERSSSSGRSGSGSSASNSGTSGSDATASGSGASGSDASGSPASSSPSATSSAPSTGD